MTHRSPLAGWRAAWLLLPVVPFLLNAGVAYADAAGPKPKETTMESAKRRAPTAKPVTHQGVRYEQLRRPQEHGFKQGGGIIGAVDVATGAMKWTVQLYETSFDPKEERDAQEVYVSDLQLDAKAGVLVATDERKRRWQIRLSDQSVTALPAAAKKP